VSEVAGAIWAIATGSIIVPDLAQRRRRDLCWPDIGG